MTTKKELTYLHWNLGRDLLQAAVSSGFSESQIPLQWLDVGEQLNSLTLAVPYKTTSVDVNHFIERGSTIAEYSTRLLKLILLIGGSCPVLQSHYIPSKELAFISMPPDKLYSITPSFETDCWVVRSYSFKNPKLCEEVTGSIRKIPSRGFYYDTSSGLGVFSYVFSELGLPRPFWDKSQPQIPLFPDEGCTLGIYPPSDVIGFARELREYGLNSQIKLHPDNPRTGNKTIEFLDYGIARSKIVKSGFDGLFHLEVDDESGYFPPDVSEQWNSEFIPNQILNRLLSDAGATKLILSEPGTRISQLNHLFKMGN